jgi:GT2 family glycosyltransferase
MPDLSVVIPSYNTASMTARCCGAVLATVPAGRSVEVIVADDGSTDGTAGALAEALPEVRVVRLEANRGFAPAANAGVEAAGGRLILLLNSDAMVEAGALQALLAAFDGDPRLGVAGARLLNEDGSAQWSGGRTPTLPWMIGVVSGLGSLARLVRRSGSAAPRREVDWVSGAAMAFRDDVWQTAGPLDERFLFYCQDIEFCLRAKAAGWNVRILEEARVTHGLGRTVAAESALQHDPERLWADLLTWGAAYYGPTWAAGARVVLVSVAAMRVCLRVLRRPWLVDAMTRAMARGVRRMSMKT